MFVSGPLFFKFSVWQLMPNNPSFLLKQPGLCLCIVSMHWQAFLSRLSNKGHSFQHHWAFLIIGDDPGGDSPWHNDNIFILTSFRHFQDLHLVLGQYCRGCQSANSGQNVDGDWII